MLLDKLAKFFSSWLGQERNWDGWFNDHPSFFILYSSH